VALPDLAHSTGATQTQLEWIIDAYSLILLRGLIGLGAALVMPATCPPSPGTFPLAERTRAVSVWAAVAGGSALLSLLCTGTLLEWF